MGLIRSLVMSILAWRNSKHAGRNEFRVLQGAEEKACVNREKRLKKSNGRPLEASLGILDSALKTVEEVT